MPGSRTTRRLLALVTAAAATPALVTAAATVALAATAAGAAPAAGPATPGCAWGTEVRADLTNVFFPDSAAAYWVLPFTVQDGLSIQLHGSFPDSRYASFTVYRNGGGTFETNGVGSALTDFRLAPEQGSRNPWQHLARAGGRFGLTLRPDAAPGQVNTLPLAPAGTPAGTPGNLVLRVYLPARGDFDRVALPDVTFTRGGVTVAVPTCARAATAAGTTVTGAAVPAAAPVRTVAAVPGVPVPFARPVGVAGIFANTDSGYLAAVVTPPAGDDVLVIRGRAPGFVPGDHPLPWPARGADMRYWSVCTNLTTALRPVVVNHLPDGSLDFGCRADQQTARDLRGDYTYVIGTEAQRAAIERIPGVTFLPFSTDQPGAPHAILLRNMLVSAGFAAAVQNVPQDGDPASAAAVMGPYYPRAAVCSLASVARRGAGACPAPA